MSLLNGDGQNERRKGRPDVALLIETSNAYARGLLRGIRAYIREHRSWSIYVGEQRRGEPAPLWLKQWHGDGIIARIESAAIAEAVVASGLPAVDVSAARYVPELLYVETDDAAIARLAAEHLLQRGFRHYGYCGDPRFNWSNWRAEHFQRLIAEAGFDCSVYRSAPRRRGTASWEQERADIAAWIRHLPKPAGVMACYDIRGREVLDACRQLGVSVPDEVAVIGVDNDELLCDLADPPLSSVIPDTQRTGYEAARLLDLLMAMRKGTAPLSSKGQSPLSSGRRELPTAHLIKPLGIVTRDSTDVLATDDSDLSAAVRFIRAHATHGIKVEDVLRAVPLSRRVLESRFQKLLGRTPHEEITRVQIERVKELLTETSLSLSAIAHRAGYRHVEYMSVAFKRETGQPPSAYRAVHRKKG
jgi:LacI family transcriptional regulator